MNDEAVTMFAALTDLVRDATHDGPVWSHASGDLNVNLVVLRAGHAIAEHANNEVDVLIVGIEGNGRVDVDGQQHDLITGQLLVIPKGSARAITPVGELFAYLTCHKRRGGLWPHVRPRTSDEVGG